MSKENTQKNTEKPASMRIPGVNIFVAGIIITVLIFASILFATNLMDNSREKILNEKAQGVVEEYEDMQTLILMSEIYGENATCIAFESILSNMNKELWDLGLKIDQYRQATEQFAIDPFYIAQKTEFNRKEVLYLTMLEQMKIRCKLNQTIVSYFYKKKEFCPDCDKQSFVLSDIKRDLEKIDNQQLSIFSFDADKDIPAIQLLIKYYNVTEYPTVVIEGKGYTGLHNKEAMSLALCEQGFSVLCVINETIRANNETNNTRTKKWIIINTSGNETE